MKKLVYIILGIAAVLAVAGTVVHYQADEIARTELVDTKISFLGDGRVEYSTFHTDTLNVVVDSLTTEQHVNYTSDSVVKVDEISEPEYEALKTQLDSTFTFSAYDTSMGSPEYIEAVNAKTVYGSVLWILAILMVFGAGVYSLRR